MASITIFLIFLCLSFSYCISQTLITFPVQNEGEEKIIVEVSDQDTMTGVYCRVENSVNITTQWSVNGTIVNFNTSTFKGLDSYSYLSVAEDPLNYANLSVSLDGFSRFEISCHSPNDTDMKTFLIGIPSAPKLIEAATLYNVTEGHSFSIDLEDTVPFPPYSNPLSSTWLINRKIINDSRITVGDYSLLIETVWRGLSGMEFNLTVSTAHGSDSQSFKLNVQYPPEAEQTFHNQVYYAEINRDVTFIAADGVGGNPVPTTEWIGPTNNKILNTMDKFIFTKVGRLQVTSITADDIGRYQFVAKNGIEMELLVNQTLLEAVPPGAPMNVSVVNIQDESVTVLWSGPSALGAPPLNEYFIELSGFNDCPSVNSSTTMFDLVGLIPGKYYNVTVTANSEYDFVDSSQSTSGLLTFKTLQGVPRIDSQTAVSAATKDIVVSVSLKHSGGYDPRTVELEAICGLTGSFQLPTRSKIGSGDNSEPEVEGIYSAECMMDCVDDQLNGKLIVEGLLTAGSKYICVVIAGNNKGDFYYNTSSATAQIGIPSAPELSLDVNPSNIAITIRSLYPGVPANDSTYSFNVAIVDQQDGNVVYNMSFNGTDNREIMVDLPIGTYLVKVFSKNRYGISAEESTMVAVIMEASVSPTIEEDDAQVLPLYVIAAIAVGGTFLIFCVFTTIALIAMKVYYKRKKDSVSFYKEDYKMTIRRY